MTTEENFKKYQEWLFRRSAYQMALSIIGIDKLTVAPPAGNAYRDARTAYLSGELFSIDTDPEILAVLKELKDAPDIDEDTRKGIQLYYEEAQKRLCIPKEEYVAFEELSNRSYDAWLEAKQKKDYSIFEPYLKEVIEAQKKLYGYRDSDLPLYERMLDDYEPGMRIADYDAFFAAVKERLLPLIKRIAEAKQPEDSFLYQNYPIDEQKKFMDELLAYLRFDPSWGYQNETEHPFTSWTCENDCRTTTKYLADNPVSAIFSTVHEVGHATYEHQCDPCYDGMILSEGISSGMHESQSRLCENYLGRTDAFWAYNYPLLQKHFPSQLAGVSLEAFMKAVNKSSPSLVRTEADELTYPVHILIRYEIEKGLFDGSISTEGLDGVWNAKYREYLGVEAKDPSEGILQDVHWSGGSFGYFPTYALGSAFAAQFMEAMRHDFDVDRALRTNRYDLCMEWLKEHIHRYGCRYPAQEILIKATGRPFDVNVYLDYLEDKYSRLYGLK